MAAQSPSVTSLKARRRTSSSPAFSSFLFSSRRLLAIASSSSSVSGFFSAAGSGPEPLESASLRRSLSFSFRISPLTRRTSRIFPLVRLSAAPGPSRR